MERVVDVEVCAVTGVHPDGVAVARAAALSVDDLTAVAALFRLLGDQTRARLLYALLDAGELCVCDLAAATGAGESTVSQALRLLRAAQVVSGRRQGRMVFYRLADSHVQRLLGLTREHVRHDRQPRAVSGSPMRDVPA